VKFIKGLFELFFPRFCYLCGRPSRALLCEFCENRVRKSLVKKDIFPRDSQLFKVHVLFQYTDELQRLIEVLKYGRRWEVAEYLVSMAGISHLEYDFLVPTPLHPVRFRERGGNQSEYIARAVSRVSGVPVWSKGVSRRRYTKPQVGLERDERIRNLKDAFRVKDVEKFLGKKLLLVDDVFTTGSTLENLAKAFKGKPLRVDGLVIASKA